MRTIARPAAGAGPLICRRTGTACPGMCSEVWQLRVLTPGHKASGLLMQPPRCQACHLVRPANLSHNGQWLRKVMGIDGSQACSVGSRQVMETHTHGARLSTGGSLGAAAQHVTSRGREGDLCMSLSRLPGHHSPFSRHRRSLPDDSMRRRRNVVTKGGKGRSGFRLHPLA